MYITPQTKTMTTTEQRTSITSEFGHQPSKSQLGWYNKNISRKILCAAMTQGKLLCVDFATSSKEVPYQRCYINRWGNASEVYRSRSYDNIAKELVDPIKIYP